MADEDAGTKERPVPDTAVESLRGIDDHRPLNASTGLPLDEGTGRNEAERINEDHGHELPSNDEAPKKAMSKNQAKKLKRKQDWEDRRDDRKRIRKEKRQIRQARKRAEREEDAANADASEQKPAQAQEPPKSRSWKPFPVPVSFIIDCDFEKFMTDQEIVSLSSQLTRSYALNRISVHQAHFYVSSFEGKLKTRFETILDNQHQRWKGASVHEEDFLEVAKLASEMMASPAGGDIIDVFKAERSGDGEAAPVRDGTDPTPIPEPEPADIDRSIVYLTSESPYTLEKLEPHTSYVIGGIVDRNREKGLCYRRAMERKVRTAKLPIGEYMAMQSRYVLTTNQVVEIMAKWLECGDWAEAFLAVIPKRKGGQLKGKGDQASTSHGSVYSEEAASLQGGQEPVDDAQAAES